jgi:predicted ATP-binding protein involved in virulence
MAAAVGVKELYALLDPLVQQALEDGGAADGSDLPPPIPLVAAYGTERAVVDVPLRERAFQSEVHRLAGLDQSLRANTRFKTVFEWFRLPELQWVRGAVARAQLHCKNPRVETKPIRMLVDFEHSDGSSEPLDINSLSDGYRTHFSLVVDVARRMVQLNPSSDLDDPIRGTNSEAVILIDEIDLHLDPAWQATVVQGLQDAFPNAQFVLTTHSEQVIGSVAASSVRKLVSGNGEVLLESVPFAQGATGERILVDLMGAKERVPGPTTEKLREYLSLVDSGEGQTPAVIALRKELELALPGEPQLHQADLEMQRRELMRKLGGKD